MFSGLTRWLVCQVGLRKLNHDWHLHYKWVRCKPDKEQIGVHFVIRYMQEQSQAFFPWFRDSRRLLSTLLFLDRVSKCYQSSLEWLDGRYLVGVSVFLETPPSNYLAGIVLPIIIPGTDWLFLCLGFRCAIEFF